MSFLEFEYTSPRKQDNEGFKKEDSLPERGPGQAEEKSKSFLRAS
jgi:hypothetical protein